MLSLSGALPDLSKRAITDAALAVGKGYILRLIGCQTQNVVQRQQISGAVPVALSIRPRQVSD